MVGRIEFAMKFEISIEIIQLAILREACQPITAFQFWKDWIDRVGWITVSDLLQGGVIFHVNDIILIIFDFGVFFEQTVWLWSEVAGVKVELVARSQRDWVGLYIESFKEIRRKKEIFEIPKLIQKNFEIGGHFDERRVWGEVKVKRNQRRHSHREIRPEKSTTCQIDVSSKVTHGWENPH